MYAIITNTYKCFFIISVYKKEFRVQLYLKADRKMVRWGRGVPKASSYWHPLLLKKQTE